MIALGLSKLSNGLKARPAGSRWGGPSRINERKVTLAKTEVTLQQARKDLKALGYGVSVVTYSEFKSMHVSKDGEVINTGNVFAKSYLEKHKPFFDYKNAHTVRDGEWKVVL